MSDKRLPNLANALAERTSRRGFLGWLGRTAGGLAASLGLFALGGLPSPGAVATCEEQEPWAPGTEGVKGCGCTPGEAREDLYNKLRELCRSKAQGGRHCNPKKCTDPKRRCGGGLTGTPQPFCIQVDPGTEGCPTCPTDQRPWVCTVDTAQCECVCLPDEAADNCSDFPGWQIERHIEGTDANDLQKKAVAECENAGNAEDCSTGLCPRNKRCKVVATYTAVENVIDGTIECFCQCQ